MAGLSGAVNIPERFTTKLLTARTKWLKRIVQEVRTKANLNDQTFGGGYAEIVDRMLTAMREKRERLLDDFKHGTMGSERL
jgi:hypothetical protein